MYIVQTWIFFTYLESVVLLNLCLVILVMRLPRYEHGIVTSRPFMILRQTDHVTNEKTYMRVHREGTFPIQFGRLEDSPMRRIASDLKECFLYWDEPMILGGERGRLKKCAHIYKIIILLYHNCSIMSL